MSCRSQAAKRWRSLGRLAKVQAPKISGGYLTGSRLKVFSTCLFRNPSPIFRHFFAVCALLCCRLALFIIWLCYWLALFVIRSFFATHPQSCVIFFAACDLLCCRLALVVIWLCCWLALLEIRSFCRLQPAVLSACMYSALYRTARSYAALPVCSSGGNMLR